MSQNFQSPKKVYQKYSINSTRERTACEQILAEMQSLKNCEFKEVFGQAFATAMLESYKEAEAEISEDLKQVVSSSVAAAFAISSRLE